MKPRAIAAIALVAALVAAIVGLAARRAAPPARCAAGMIALGPRCCGEGQRLEGDRCVGSPSRCAATLEPSAEGCRAIDRRVRIAGGSLHIGPGDWEAQGVVEPRDVAIAPFEIDVFEITEARYQICSTQGRCAPLALSGEPARALSNVTLDEAAALCAYAGGRLPTPEELAFASGGAASRRYPWGDTGAVCRRAAWGLLDGPCGEGARGPELVGSHPDGATPDGVQDLSGNVAEWARSASGAEVRGGGFATSAASALRTWQRRVVPPDTRSPEIGARCVYPL